MLSTPKVNRSPNHLRTIKVESFECEDGSIQFELSLIDQKRFAFGDRERGELKPGDPIHGINARITINRNLEVLDIETDLEHMPFSYCQGGAVNTTKLIGKNLGRGWRRSVQEAMGSERGCAHLAELLLLASTVAFQTQAIQRSHSNKEIGSDDALQKEPPFFIGGCHSWTADSPVTRKYFPQFVASGSNSKLE